MLKILILSKAIAQIAVSINLPNASLPLRLLPYGMQAKV
ncbi:hypothetical protein Anacy_0552 [Anabaena cylindrica PCC 7122]|uniref:Uncharacterized protein n=1 Tax=Anabaena cylindrica (strain ATCC 27899 / PCC 7122) TaxID=272123 RepID=K9ZC00_ANACC|nr:hypothetical protein Anacy_0552 [Anabaena cylindrica PCC 7122]BAY01422.1 hypothetical protein NIES19_06540 [Anabaena cylindrica PCC 7122]